VVIGIDLVLALNVGLDPVFSPVGVPVGFDCQFFAGFVNGGNQAHGELSLGYGGWCPGGFPGALWWVNGRTSRQTVAVDWCNYCGSSASASMYCSALLAFLLL